MNEAHPLSKADLIDQRLRDRRDVGLHEWVEAKLADGVSWRQMEADLDADIGWERRPITREGLRRWWQRQGAAA